jgi:hypothetical protein
VTLLPLLSKLRCPVCHRTISTYNIISTLTPEDTRKLQQLIAIATHNSLQLCADLPAAVAALTQVRAHAMKATCCRICATVMEERSGVALPKEGDRMPVDLVHAGPEE